ncbi:hypothetical protein O7B34_15890 [Mesorhizobium sp. Cs1299R1N3]
MRGWKFVSEDEAIDAAVSEYGKDQTTSVACCAFVAQGDSDRAGYRFWFDLFLKLAKSDHAGWA